MSNLKKDKEIKAGVLTDDIITRLKFKHGDLILITVEGAGDFVFKKPDMATVSAVCAISKDDPMASNICLFNNCLVWGDADAVNDVSIMLSISTHLDNLLEVKLSTVKKL